MNKLADSHEHATNWLWQALWVCGWPQPAPPTSLSAAIAAASVSTRTVSTSRRSSRMAASASSATAGRVAVEKPELLVGDEQWHHRGLGIRRPRTLSEARWLQEGSRIGGCKVYRPPLGARPGGGGGRAETEGVIGEVERWCGTRSGESRDSKGTGPRIQFGN